MSMETKTKEEIKKLYQYVTGQEISMDNLNEMAYERKFIKFYWESKTAEILKNWCMIMYCCLYGNSVEKRNIEHWKEELNTLMSDCMTMSLKSGDKFNTRKKILNEIWIKGREYNTENKVKAIYSIIRAKFDEEFSNIRKANIEYVIRLFQKNIDNMTDMIAQTDGSVLYDYTSNLEQKIIK